MQSILKSKNQEIAMFSDESTLKASIDFPEF